ncbi:MAG: hypothetical protein K2X93_08555 [Candidatus Obscuribacterales bacterium]|nr:hypothetical protein [Candidatus Obscuribacterales bacterium]
MLFRERFQAYSVRLLQTEPKIASARNVSRPVLNLNQCPNGSATASAGVSQASKSATANDLAHNRVDAQKTAPLAVYQPCNFTSLQGTRWSQLMLIIYKEPLTKLSTFMYSGNGNTGASAPEGGSDKTSIPTSFDTTTNSFLDSFSKPGEQFSGAKTLSESLSGSGYDPSFQITDDSINNSGGGTAPEVADGTNVNDGTNGDGTPGRAVEASSKKTTDATVVAANNDGAGGSDAPARPRSPGGFRGSDGTRGGGC